jgi:E3 ubiquitin-protein ligase RNFT1
VIMIPRTWQRFRAAASQQEAGSSSSSSSSSSSRNVMFSEEAHRAIAADRVPLVPLTDVVGGVNDSFSTFSWFDFQQIAKMVDQILPFSLLLLIVLIRRHMECMIFFCFSSFFCPSNVGLDCGVFDV